MFKKAIGITVVASMVVGLPFMAKALPAAQVFSTIYQLASSGDLASLERFLKAGHSLELVNKNGNTPLCSAVISANRTAYNTLIKAGADLNADCMKRLTPKQTKNLCQKGALLNNAICSASSVKTAAKTGISVNWATVGGAALLGTVGVAAAAGGGGGGGGGGTPPVDLCAGIECGAHGSCEAGLCVCTDDYYGDRCENAPLVCENGGVWNATTLRCDCVSGFYGDTCSLEPMDCQNGGTWNESLYKCECPIGYSGEVCEVADLCIVNSINCGDHGVCNDGACTCLDNYYGEHCENAPLVCENGGNWDSVEHKCSCVNGYTGDKCEIKPDPCYNVDCGVHGTCVAGACVCTDDFKGNRCEIPPETNIEAQAITSIDVAIPGTSQDGTIINGVFTNPLYSREPDGVNPDYVAGTEEVKVSDFENADYQVSYLAEFGGVAELAETDTIEAQGNDEKAVVGMWANGVSADAIPEENQGIVILSEASKVSNAGGISMTENANTNQGVVALKGTSAGTVMNLGEIELTTRSEKQSAGILATGLGSMVQHSGTITLNVLDKSKNVSGIWAEDRQVLTSNASVIDIILGKGVISSEKRGDIRGIYGDTIVNRGTINVSADDAVADGETLKANVYAMMTSGAGKGYNDGTINLDLTNMLYDVYGVTAVSDADSATLTNNGTIKATGKLYGDPNISRQIVLLGSYEGMDDIIRNEGTIEADIDVSNGGKLALMQGNSGSLVNNANLKLSLGFSDGSELPFNISAMAAQSASLTNKGNIDITIAEGQTDSASLVTAMGGIYNKYSSDMENHNKISVKSSLDGLTLSVFGSSSGTKTNEKSGKIYITTDAEDSNIITAQGGGGSARNDGIVVLTHSGSGNIEGFGGGNRGKIYIYANDMHGNNEIVGLATSGGDNSESSSALIDIKLTGKTAAEVVGTSSTGLMPFSTANIVKIQATDANRQGDLSVAGHLASGSFTRTGNTLINVTGNENDGTYVYGIVGSSATINHNGNIEINVDLKNSLSHQIFGIYEEGESNSLNPYKAVNNGVISLKVTGEHNTDLDGTNIPFDVVGMATASIAENASKGVISIEVDGSAKAAGMVAFNGGVIRNKGTIKFNGNADNFTAFYATGEREHFLAYDKDGAPIKYEHLYATVYNAGNIIINGSTELSDAINPKGEGYQGEAGGGWAKDVYDWKEVGKLDDGTKVYGWVRSLDMPYGESTSGLYASFDNPLTGTTTLLNASDLVTLNDGMRYVSEKGGVVTAMNKHLLGNVIAGTSLVQGAFDDVYVGQGQGEGAIVSDGNPLGLGLSSDSAMFDATYALNEQNSNGLDIVMTRRAFSDIVENKSLAAFLEMNYQSGNNENFFNQLKSFGNVASLSAGLNDLTGQNMLSRFNFEDMTMMRELNFDMNNNLFRNKEQHFQVAGRLTPMAFKGDKGSDTKYSLFNRRAGKWSVGLGVAFTDVRSDDEHNDNARHESMYQLVVPFGYQAKNGLQFITAPKLGYARGSYDRTGFEGKNYDGTIEKQVFGLMNEARYPINMGKWRFEPAAELNVLGYKQHGREDEKEYSLNIKNQTSYSVESGIGFYLVKDENLTKDSHLKLTAGVAAYHEFADPYQMELGMTGLEGTFTIRDENRSDNRAVVRLGFDYTQSDMSLYGSFMSYIDREIRSTLKTGMKWHF